MIHFISQQTRLFESREIVNSSFEELRDWITWKKLQVPETEQVYIEADSETSGFFPQLNDKLLTLQLGDFDRQFVIEMSSYAKHTPQALPQILRDIFSDERLTFLLQNAKFDLRFLFAYGLDAPRVWDTFLAECLLTAGLRETKEQKEVNGLGLDDLAEKYLKVSLDKSIRGNIHREGLTDRVIRYAADDVKYLGKIRDVQLVELTKWGLLNVMDLENQVVRVFAKMEYDGIFLDADKWKAVAAITSANTKDLESQLDHVVVHDPHLGHYLPRYYQSNLFDTGVTSTRPSITWSSPTQKLRVLNDALRNTSGTSGKVSSTDEKTLAKLKKQHPIVPLLIEYAKQSKLASSFGYDFLKHQDKGTSRVYPNYWQILSTGRISAKDPNVNQIPSKGELAKAIRAAFVAPSGRKIVGGDYSGMELRIIAEFSKDPLWIESFQKGDDLHSVLCAQTFKSSYQLDIADVKKPFPPKPDWSFRDIQKTIGFGLAYGMTKFKLSNTAQIAIDIADEIITAFFAACPQVEKFLTALGRNGVSRNDIRTAQPYGRIRFFDPTPNKSLLDSCYGNLAKAKLIKSGEIERASKNMPIQGTNADIIKLALINTQKVIDEEKLDVKIILSVYDEIQTECAEEYAEVWSKRLEDIMITSAQVVLKSVPVVVDVAVNSHWKK